jgi:P-type Ca2+ transporter type 2C
VRDELRTVFSVDTFADRRFLLTSGMSFAAIVLGTELGLFERILGTVSLTLNEWLLCVAAALPIIGLSEVQKLMLRRRQPAADGTRAVPAPVAGALGG